MEEVADCHIIWFGTTTYYFKRPLLPLMFYSSNIDSLMPLNVLAVYLLS